MQFVELLCNFFFYICIEQNMQLLQRNPLDPARKALWPVRQLETVITME